MKYSQKGGRKPDNYIILQIQMANRVYIQPDRASLLLWYAPPYQTLPERLSIDTSKTLKH